MHREQLGDTTTGRKQPERNALIMIYIISSSIPLSLHNRKQRYTQSKEV